MYEDNKLYYNPKGPSKNSILYTNKTVKNIEYIKNDYGYEKAHITFTDNSTIDILTLPESVW